MRLIRAIMFLPFPVLVVIPAILLTLFQWKWVEFDSLVFAFSLLLFISGIFLAVWTMILFVNAGKGTPAPWDPPKQLVIKGPYCYMRNPMLTAVWVLLIGEMILFQSASICIWTLLFILINMVYFPLFEEPTLHKRFGKDYESYCAHVPRYLPRFTPWYLPKKDNL